MRLELFGYRLEIDRTATIRAYSAARSDCSCAYCENLRAAYFYLPQTFLDALYQLGVDPSMPSGSTEYSTNEDGSHHYHVWYHIVGKRIKKMDIARNGFGRVMVETGASVDISDRHDLMPDGFPEPAIQIDIFANLPWVISPLENG